MQVEGVEMTQSTSTRDMTVPIAEDATLPEVNRTVRRLVKDACESGQPYGLLESKVFMAAHMGDMGAFSSRAPVTSYWMRRLALTKYVYHMVHEKRRAGVDISVLLSELRLAVLQGHRDYLNAIRPFDPDATQEIPVPRFWRAT